MMGVSLVLGYWQALLRQAYDIMREGKAGWVMIDSMEMEHTDSMSCINQATGDMLYRSGGMEAKQTSQWPNRHL